MSNDTQQLDERLSALDPVDRAAIDAAQADAQVLMRRILNGEGPRDTRRPTPAVRRPWSFGLGRLASLAAALLVALVVAGIATTPGQAVTSWVGQRIGIASTSGPPAQAGRLGGQPSMQSLRAFAHQGASPAGGQPAVVVARGNLPFGRHYEVVAYRPKPSDNGATAERVCFELDFPEVRSLGTAGCELPAKSTSLVFQEIGENASATRSFSYATGLVGADVAAVDVDAHGRAADVRLVRIPADLLERFGVHRPVKLFMATFADGAEGPVTVTARDAAGAQVDQDALDARGG
jgi:hypothetical protein